MTKAPLAFRTISEVSDTLDVPQHVLRFWEGKFPQIKPLKRAGGRRYYRPEDIDLLRGIRTLLYAEGYTIKGVQKLLRMSGGKYVCDIGRFGMARAGRAGGVSSDLDYLSEEDESDVEDAVLDTEAGDGGSEGARFDDLQDEAPRPSEDGRQSLELRREKLEAALQELLSLRDMLRAARPRRIEAA